MNISSQSDQELDKPRQRQLHLDSAVVCRRFATRNRDNVEDEDDEDEGCEEVGDNGVDDFIEADEGDPSGSHVGSETPCPAIAVQSGCCLLFPRGRTHQPFAQSLSSLTTCSSSSSRSSACEVAASTEWLLQADASSGAASTAAGAGAASASPCFSCSVSAACSATASASVEDEAFADPTRVTESMKPFDKLSSSLRLSARSSPGPRAGKFNSALCIHHYTYHQHQHQHLRVGRPGANYSRWRSSAISAKSKAQYMAQYKASKVSYFRAVISGKAPVKERPSRDVELESCQTLFQFPHRPTPSFHSP